MNSNVCFHIYSQKINAVLSLVLSLTFLMMPVPSQAETPPPGDMSQLIESAQDYLHKVDAELQQKNKARAVSFFEQGKKFYEQGQLEKSKAAWTEFLKIAQQPGMEDLMKSSRASIEEITGSAISTNEESLAPLNSLQKLKEEMRVKEMTLINEVQKIYDQAVATFQKDDFEASLVQFQHVNSLIEDFSQTESYLIRLPDLIVEKQARIERVRREREETLSREAERIRLERLAKIEAEKKSQQLALENRAKELYTKGQRWYKQKNWEAAQARFADVQKLFPGFLRTEEYLENIAKEIKEQKNGQVSLKIEEHLFQEVASPAVYEGVEKKNKGIVFTTAKTINKEELKKKVIVPKHVIEELAAQEAEEVEEVGGVEDSDIQNLVQHVEPLYRRAEQAYKKEDYQTAHNEFSKVQQFFPNYRKTTHYLTNLKSKVQNYK